MICTTDANNETFNQDTVANSFHEVSIRPASQHNITIPYTQTVTLYHIATDAHTVRAICLLLECKYSQQTTEP